MKRSIVLSLLCTLAVATLFIMTSCKSGIISDGSSGAPPKEPGDYIKVGRSFQKISDASRLDSNSWGDITLEEFAQKAISIPADCTTIEYACRLTPTQTRDALSRGLLAQEAFRDIRIFSATTFSNPREDYQNCVEAGQEHIYVSDAEDHSQYKDGDTYILLVFKLPISPEGKYFLILYGERGWIALQQNK